MIRAYLFALDPTEQQAEAMRSHCGAQRVAYNWCLAQVKANWAQRAAEQTYGLTGDQLTPWINTSAYSLRKAWNAAKDDAAPWWAENSKEAYSSGCANLSTALGNRRGGRARMPRFKSKRRSRLSCRFTTGAFGLGADRRHIRLPVIGAIRTCESMRKLARKVEAGTARIRSATLSHQRGRWHVAFSVDVDEPAPIERAGGRAVGVDLGSTDLATLSTGGHVPNPRRLDQELRSLRRVQRTCARRRGPDRRTRTEPSNRWRKARARADAIHTRVANLRRNDTHQLTSRLVRDFDTIVIENLHVAGMLRAGSSPTEPMSDQRGLPRWQSDRCGKAAQTVNATAARRWLDERDRTSRSIERWFTTVSPRPRPPDRALPAPAVVAAGRPPRAAARRADAGGRARRAAAGDPGRRRPAGHRHPARRGGDGAPG